MIFLLSHGFEITNVISLKCVLCAIVHAVTNPFNQVNCSDEKREDGSIEITLSLNPFNQVNCSDKSFMHKLW